MTSAFDATLTEADEADILARRATIHFNRASIKAQRLPVTGIAGAFETRFVMEGPSGRHSLLVDATDLERLNAHWTVFVTDPRNARAA
jgi:hypothetical protein